jgi:hypothetical protein
LLFAFCFLRSAFCFLRFLRVSGFMVQTLT